MKITILPSANRGFTLVELLVVIALIVILASVGFGVGNGAINSARKVTAQNDITNLILAVDGFYDEYQRLPVPQSAGDTGSDDYTTETDSNFMNILVGFDEEMNDKGIRFFNGREAKGKTRSTARGGLFYETNGRSVELFDPWRRDGAPPRNRHYYMTLDTNYDEEIQSPVRSNQTLYGKRAIAWSVGKDGELGSASSQEETRDNVYSWND